MQQICRKVEIFRSNKRAEAHLKKLADKKKSLGVSCLTPVNFISRFAADSGLDFELINEGSRFAALFSIVQNLENPAERYYFSSSSMLEFLSNFVSKVAGSDEFERIYQLLETDDDSLKLSDLEKTVISITNDYFLITKKKDLFELGTITGLCEDKSSNNYKITIHDEIDFLPPIKKTFDMLGAKDRSSKDNPIFNIEKCASKLDINVVKLGGCGAKLEAIFKILQQHEGSNILVASDKARFLFDGFSKICKENQSSFAGEHLGRIKLAETKLGRALNAAHSIFYPNIDYDIYEAASDFALSPYSGLSTFNSIDFDRKLRKHEISIDLEDPFSCFSESKNYKMFCDLFSNNSRLILSALDSLQASIQKNPLFTFIDSHIESNAMMAFSRMINECNKFDVNISEAIPAILDLFSIELHQEFQVENEKGRVAFCQNTLVDKLADGEFDVVICDDIGADVYNLKEVDEAFDKLLNVILPDYKQNKSLNAYAAFSHNFLASKKCTYLLFPVKNDLGAENYPSYLYSKLASCCKNCPEDLLNRDIEVSISENNIPFSLGLTSVGDVSKKRVVVPSTFELDNKEEFKKFIRLENIDGENRHVLSPSAIENYVQCPYKWFWNNKIAQMPIDRALDNKILGEIAHLSFANFFGSLCEGQNEVCPSALDLKVIDEIYPLCFDRAVLQVLKLELNIDDLSEVGQLANMSISKIKDDCIVFLKKMQNQNYPYFVFANEFEIDIDNSPQYAGVNIVGKIDRVDISDDNKSFVIVDYKGNVANHNNSYSFNINESDAIKIPFKVQALIYASAYQKMSNKSCDGAIYLSYKSKIKSMCEMAGVASPKLKDFAGDQYEKMMVDFSVDDYLNHIENVISLKIENLLNGNIYPNPICPECCEYCKALDCPMRLKKAKF